MHIDHGIPRQQGSLHFEKLAFVEEPAYALQQSGTQLQAFPRCRGSKVVVASRQSVRHGRVTQLLTRSTYSPVRVSILMTLPSLRKAGPLNSAPVSTLTGLVTFVAVSPLAPGSHSITFNST